MKDPKKKFLQIISDTAKTGEDITQSPSAWEYLKAWRNIASNMGAPGTISGSNISTGAKAIKNNASAIGHTTLDVAGMAPVVGAGADAINASWYASQGDTTNAALSSAALIPGAGQFVTGGKYMAKLRKVFGLGKNTSKNVPNPKSPVTETSFKSKNTTPLKELPNYGDMRGANDIPADFSKGGPVDKIIQLTRNKGAIYDKNLSGNFNWTPKMFRRMPDVGGRKMVDVNPGGGLDSQRFYESTSLGNKKLVDGSSSRGTWVPIEGYGRSTDTPDWFIKGRASHEGSVIGPGWDDAYGSKVFKNMGKVISKMGY